MGKTGRLLSSATRASMSEGEMSDETDRYYAEGYESGSMDLHKWMRRAELAEARIAKLEAALSEMLTAFMFDRIGYAQNEIAAIKAARAAVAHD